MSGKTVIVSGASSGIGAAAARQFAALGARVVPIGRSAERTRAVARELGVEGLVCDFARLADVRRLAGEILARAERIDVLANNAGILVPRRTVTVDGHEMTFQVNHLAPFLLTMLLYPRLRSSALAARVRVVTTSSLGNRFARLRLDDLEWEHRRYGGGWIVYSTTKLMNVLFTQELARRTAGTGIEPVCLHPGGPATNFASGTRAYRVLERTGLRRRMGTTADEAARPLVWLASSADLSDSRGSYYDRFRADARVHRDAADPRMAQALWLRSARLLGLHGMELGVAS
jgi:NAD(P)-dependent dehydrogenase (short-subunit alcohol dehydrogenase family)